MRDRLEEYQAAQLEDPSNFRIVIIMIGMRFNSSHRFVIVNWLCVYSCFRWSVRDNSNWRSWVSHIRSGWLQSIKMQMLVLLFTVDWMRYVASQTLSNIVCGPIHGQRNLRSIAFGMTELNNMTRSPVLCVSP